MRFANFQLDNRIRVIGLAVLGALVACGDGDGGTGPPQPPTPVATSIVLKTHDADVSLGAIITLTAEVRDQSGQIMPTAPITWTSRDPAMASVTASGSVRGELAGETWIVASSGLLADSARVQTRFVVAPGEARLRMTGAVQASYTWEGAAIFHDHLGTTTGDAGVILLGAAVDMVNGTASDPGVGIVVPFDPAVGVTLLPALNAAQLQEIDPTDLGVAHACLRVGTSQRFEVYCNSGESSLRIDQTNEPPAVGMEMGSIRGRLVLRAAGWDAEELPSGNYSITPNGKQLTLFADFDIVHAHWTAATMTGSIAGGPFSGQLKELDGAVEWIEGGGLLVAWSSLENTELEPVVLIGMRTAIPGTFPVGAVDPFDLTALPDYSALLDYGNDDLVALSTGGTLSLTTVTPPASTMRWGEMRGRLQATTAIWSDVAGGLTGGTATLDITFHVPALMSSELPITALGARRIARTARPPGLIPRLRRGIR
jgi:hypothetical protein